MKLLIPTLVLTLLLASAAAGAGKRFADGKRETTPLAQNGRVDIIAVSGGRFAGDLRFTVTMRKQLRPGRANERPLLLINTRGDGRSDPEYLLYGDDVFDVRGDRQRRIGVAQFGAKGRTWSYRFDPKVIPGLDRYGWAAATNKGRAEDIAPNDRYIRAQA